MVLTAAWSRQGKPETLELRAHLMKLVVVTQWVRTAGASPTGPKPSQQVWSEVHVHTQQWAYEAGRNEDAGRVIEPRKVYSRGQQDSSQRCIERKADGFQAPEGSSPRHEMASGWDTTGV
jgi:hypothetical protein